MSFSLRQSLLTGFGIVLALFIGAILFINNQVASIQKIQSVLINTRVPTVLVGEKILDGVHHSLAGLRGYMILGDDPKKGKQLKAERAEGWGKIDSMLTKYDKLSVNWTEPVNLASLNALKISIEKFRTAQQAVEDIAQTPDNVPAVQLLFTKAAPLAQQVSSAITNIIELEENLPATPERKKLLKLFADSRGSFVSGLASIRAYLLSGRDAFRKEFLEKWNINEIRFNEISQKIDLLSSSQKTHWDTYAKSRTVFAKLPAQMFILRTQEDWNKANYLLATKAAPRAREITSIITKMANLQYDLKLKDIEKIKHENYILSTIGSMIALISIVLGVVIALLLSHSLVSQLNTMVNAASQLTKGDLTFKEIKMGRFKEFNVLGKAFNDTKVSLHSLVSKILHSSKYLSSHTQDLEALIDNSYNIANKQQDNTNTIVNSMSEMVRTVEAVSSNTIEAANSAEDADTSTSSGHKVVEQTVTSITELAGAIEKAADTINKLGEETNAVDTILSAISGIADQTNLLALNAAIEAARAGEQGRGFAVVADEVRALAARTQESTIEIRTMLDRLKIGANNAVEVMSIGHQQAQESVEKANIASETLDNIAKEMKVIKDMNTQIASAAEQQNAVTLDMTNNVNTIDSGASEVSNASKESMQSIHEISTLMNELEKNVAQFKT